MSDVQTVRIVPLGGLGEIGLNMMVVEAADDLLVIDAGLMFPDEEMFGIDHVIPDMNYLLAHREKIRAVLLTHGHEDHTGALPYLLREMKVPVYGTRLSLGLAAEKLKEANLLADADLKAVRPRDRLRFGPFEVEFLQVCHSIPDGVALAIGTPAGMIVHTGDFKFDQSPVDVQLTDYRRLAELGDGGVLALLSDSTNAGRDGFTPSEAVVGRAFDAIFREAQGRVIVACFASNIHRVQQIFDAAAALGKRVAVCGKSMMANTRIAAELGRLRIPDDALVSLDELERLPVGRRVIVTTGSQGEPLSAIARMAAAEHKQVQVSPGDTVVFSARVIPGNEKSIARTINGLYRQGARVITEETSQVHVSGHASREELKLMLNLIRPTFFVPIHGEYRHLRLHAQIAREVGVSEARTLVIEDGDILEFDGPDARIVGKAPVGRIFVDGKGIGDVGDAVIRDRQRLAQEGVVAVVLAVDRHCRKLVTEPQIVCSGFVHAQDSKALTDGLKTLVASVLESASEEDRADLRVIEQRIKTAVKRQLQKEIERRPMILSVIVEV
ncbi:ribonuclease J [Candidatus Methylomirabilis lanthanidiphila]|uniref:Ribonuclease J n=1 Tax=Candidatus Methylomirabilis lanthanidiphila TaxID=2211376 RepID=A0A564ZPN6_9BACT|nr:ribonuclease J [Candidatus Methylomirabilis lanthanidiphila]VUZ86612.1 ribonuclease J [Candidatus Methylomirabilis lanthanidiphila]